MNVEAMYGVDFSAHRRKSGHRTWITRGVPREGYLEIDWSRCSSDVLHGRPTKRAETLESLVEFLSDKDDAIVGLDFPFGLPSAVIEEHFEADEWRDFLSEFPGDWVSPKEMFDAVNGTDVSNLRETDKEHKGQAPTDWRIKTQTYHGILDVLSPLVNDHGARVGSLSMEGDGVLLLETYPSGVFSAENLHRDGYKDVPEASRTRRKENLLGLRRRGVLLSNDVASVAKHNDDALDSIAAAYAAWKNHDAHSSHSYEGNEGHIYV